MDLGLASTETTTYSVTVSTGNVSEIDDVIVTVNPIPNANAGNDITIESGANTTLTATGGNEYLWSTGDTIATLPVSNPGTYWLRLTFPCGVEYDTIVISEKTIPYSVALGRDTAICTNVPITLQPDKTGLKYLWNTGDTTATLVTDVLGTYSLKMTFGCGEGFDTINITSRTQTKGVSLGLDSLFCTSPINQMLTVSSPDIHTTLWSNGTTSDSLIVT